MKLNTITRATFTGEYWDFTSATDPVSGGLVSSFFYLKDITGVLASEANAGIVSLYVPEQLRFGTQIRKLQDKNGTYVNALSNGEPGIIYVGTGEPVLNVWGLIDGFRYNVGIGS